MIKDKWTEIGNTIITLHFIKCHENPNNVILNFQSITIWSAACSLALGVWLQIFHTSKLHHMGADGIS